VTLSSVSVRVQVRGRKHVVALWPLQRTRIQASLCYLYFLPQENVKGSRSRDSICWGWYPALHYKNRRNFCVDVSIFLSGSSGRQTLFGSICTETTPFVGCVKLILFVSGSRGRQPLIRQYMLELIFLAPANEYFWWKKTLCQQRR
jgi:hypothetical protein